MVLEMWQRIFLDEQWDGKIFSRLPASSLGPLA
jgi:hypothetical protein